MHGVFAIFLLAAFWHDVREAKIPNRYTLAGTAIGIAYHAVCGGWDGMLRSLVGFAAGFGIMLALHVIGAVGAGDVKLFGAVGAMAGGEFVLNGIVNSLLFAGLIGVAIVIARKEAFRRFGTVFAILFNLLVLRDVRGAARLKRSGAMTFPFMYAVLPAMFVTSLYCAPGL